MGADLILAIAVAALSTGAGAILTTYGRKAVRQFGIILMCGSLPCFLIWLFLDSPPPKKIAAGPNITAPGNDNCNVAGTDNRVTCAPKVSDLPAPSVVTVNNSGPCSGNTVTGDHNSQTNNCQNYGPTPPTLRTLRYPPIRSNPPGSFAPYSFLVDVEVMDTIPAKRLTCEAKMDGNVVNIFLSRDIGVTSTAGTDTANGAMAIVTDSPVGIYEVVINIKKPKPTPNWRCVVQ